MATLAKIDNASYFFKNDALKILMFNTQDGKVTNLFISEEIAKGLLKFYTSFEIAALIAKLKTGANVYLKRYYIEDSTSTTDDFRTCVISPNKISDKNQWSYTFISNENIIEVKNILPLIEYIKSFKEATVDPSYGKYDTILFVNELPELSRMIPRTVYVTPSMQTFMLTEDNVLGTFDTVTGVTQPVEVDPLPITVPVDRLPGLVAPNPDIYYALDTKNANNLYKYDFYSLNTEKNGYDKFDPLTFYTCDKLPGTEILNEADHVVLERPRMILYGYTASESQNGYAKLNDVIEIKQTEQADLKLTNVYYEQFEGKPSDETFKFIALFQSDGEKLNDITATIPGAGAIYINHKELLAIKDRDYYVIGTDKIKHFDGTEFTDGEDVEAVTELPNTVLYEEGVIYSLTKADGDKPAGTYWTVEDGAWKQVTFNNKSEVSE